MTQAVIVQGCKTDHGGVVIQSNASTLVNGIGMAAKGYMVACPKCKAFFQLLKVHLILFFLIIVRLL